MSDSMQTTVLGVDAQGRTTADFTGGVALHEDYPASPGGIDGLGWLDAGSVLRELIYGNLTAGEVHQLLIEVAGHMVTLLDSAGESDFLFKSERGEPIEQSEANRFAQDPKEQGVLVNGGFGQVEFVEAKVSLVEGVYHELGKAPRGIAVFSGDTNVTFAYSNVTEAGFAVKGQRETAVSGTAAFSWIAIG